MNFRGLLYLGARYLTRHKARTLILVSAFTLVWLLPSLIAMVVGQVENRIRARAGETPFLLGKSGSALELAFNGLYFTKPEIQVLPFREVEAVQADDLATAIPIYSRFTAGKNRIVGTSIDYFSFRGLEIVSGRQLLRLGDCVVGAKTAEENGIVVGDAVISSPETLFDLGGVYPLKMKVVGVLARSGTPDDSAIFVDVKTCWIIEGLGHGHDGADQLDPDKLLKSDGETGVIRVNAAVEEYNEITETNAANFHFHGDTGDHPVTAAVLIPHGVKEQALLKGAMAADKSLQMVSPSEEMDELFETVFSVQQIVLWILFAVGVATVLIGVLVFLLSNRLRKDEFRQLKMLGADVSTMRALVVYEAVFVILVSLLLSGALLFLFSLVTPGIVRSVLAG
ncbi:ABC transporter permease [Verrucomicrobiales bacterium]|nr:ABC transporter permease [Verrucomicrobiales bacterium]